MALSRSSLPGRAGRGHRISVTASTLLAVLFGTVLAPAAGNAAAASAPVSAVVDPAAAPVALIAESGAGQSVQTGHPFPDWLVARVLDAQGDPIEGVEVTFTIQAPGGANQGTASFPGGAQSITVATDVNGDAVNRAADQVLTAGAVGDLMILATVAGLATPAEFPQMVVAPIPVVQFVSGDAQTAGTRMPFAEPVTIQVADQTYGQLLPGLPVTFTLVTGGDYSATASFPGGAQSFSTTTDARGRASSAVITAGTITGGVLLLACADADPCPSSGTAASSLTVIDAPPTQMTIMGGADQTAHFGDSFGSPVIVSVLDATNHPAGGAVTVEFRISTGLVTFADGSMQAEVLLAADAPRPHPRWSPGSRRAPSTSTSPSSTPWCRRSWSR
jgi:hypothetical protein